MGYIVIISPITNRLYIITSIQSYSNNNQHYIHTKIGYCLLYTHYVQFHLWIYIGSLDMMILNEGKTISYELFPLNIHN